MAAFESLGDLVLAGKGTLDDGTMLGAGDLRDQSLPASCSSIQKFRTSQLIPLFASCR
jgi:hypothetical protein